MLQDEIRKRLGSAYRKTGDNNYELWLNCYRGEYPWLGGDNLESLNLASSIASELARISTIELKSEVSSDTLQKPYKSLIDNQRKAVEYGLALGGIIYKPYRVKDEIVIDYVSPDGYVILGFNTFGKINHIVFLDCKERYEKDKKIYYTRLEEHKIDDKYFITNTAYRSEQPNTLGKQIPLKLLSDWGGLSEEWESQYTEPLFGYFKNPQANNLNLRDYEGISCFSRALSLIQDADEQYQRILWEYRGSELAIDADITVFKDNGEMPVGKERLFRNLGLDQKDGFYSVFSPDIRDSSLFNGLNKILRRIEFTVGLAYGTMSEVDETDKTATEVKASKQRSYATVVDIQKEMQKCLEDTIKAMAYWMNIKEEQDISFEFDDSLVVDSEQEQKIRLQEVSAGLIKPEQYLMWRYGVSEKQAQEMLPEVEDDGKEDDLE